MIPWIKSHPAQAAVFALTIGLAASSVELYREYASFHVSEVDPRPEANSLPVPDSATAKIDSALTAARSPRLWRADAPDAGRLFASKPYVLIDGKLQRPEGKMFHPPVPNDRLMEHGLNLLDPNVLSSDPDNDGFSTLQEWEGMDTQSHLGRDGKPVLAPDGRPLPDDSTNPVDAASHPPYHTRLFVERIEQIPFHLRFLSYDVDPKDPRQVTVQINAVPGRTEFVAVGQPLRHAPFDVKSFTAKDIPGRDGTTRDVSEVVMVDRRSGEEVILPKRQVVNSPESYAVLRYDWARASATASKPARYRLRKNETFQLPPDGDIYRVTEVRAGRVVITTPSGENYIPRYFAAPK